MENFFQFSFSEVISHIRNNREYEIFVITDAPTYGLLYKINPLTGNDELSRLENLTFL